MFQSQRIGTPINGKDSCTPGTTATRKKNEISRALSTLGAVKTFTSPLEAARRCLIITPSGSRTGAAPPSGVTVMQETLDNVTGGYPDGFLTGKRARVIAVPGPECTLRDIAAVTLPLFNLIDPVLTLDELVCAIFAYNAASLYSQESGICPPQFPLDAPVVLFWNVGDQLTLPLEIKTADTGGPEIWAADLPQVHALADAALPWRNFLMSDDPSNAATELSLPSNLNNIPELDALINQIRAPGASADDCCRQIAAELRKKMLVNSCECVFFVCEAVRRLAAMNTPALCAPDFLLSVITVFFKDMDAHHALLMAALSGGNAAFRRFYCNGCSRG